MPGHKKHRVPFVLIDELEALEAAGPQDAPDRQQQRIQRVVGVVDLVGGGVRKHRVRSERASMRTGKRQRESLRTEPDCWKADSCMAATKRPTPAGIHSIVTRYPFLLGRAFSMRIHSHTMANETRAKHVHMSSTHRHGRQGS